MKLLDFSLSILASIIAGFALWKVSSNIVKKYKQSQFLTKSSKQTIITKDRIKEASEEHLIQDQNVTSKSSQEIKEV